MRAQDSSPATAGPPKFLNMVHQELKPGRVWEYDELETSIARIYAREAIPVYWVELESITGPSEVLYLNLFDSSEDLAKSEKALSAALAAHPELAQTQDRLLQENTSSGTTVLGVRRDDMGYRANTIDFSKMRALRLSTVFAHPGYERAFMETVWSLSEASQKANARTAWAVYEVVSGLPEPAFVIVTPMQSLNEMDDVFDAGQALKKAEGGALEQHLQELARIAYGTTDTRLFLVGPKMSHVSKELAASDPDFWSPPTPAAPPPAPAKTEKSQARPAAAPASPRPCARSPAPNTPHTRPRRCHPEPSRVFQRMGVRDLLFGFLLFRPSGTSHDGSHHLVAQGALTLSVSGPGAFPAAAPPRGGLRAGFSRRGLQRGTPRFLSSEVARTSTRSRRLRPQSDLTSRSSDLAARLRTLFKSLQERLDLVLGKRLTVRVHPRQ